MIEATTEHIWFRNMDVTAKENQLRVLKMIVHAKLEDDPNPGLLCFVTSFIEQLHP